MLTDPLSPPPWWLPLAAFAADCALGDPPWPPHPVVLMGRLIAWLEARLYPRPGASPWRQRLAGAALVTLTVAAAYGATAAALALAAAVHPWLGVVAAVWLASTCLAARSLAEHALAVWRPLVAGDLPAARQAVARMVGRDTHGLDASEVVRAAVESVAESASDGFVAPFLYLCLGGPALAMAYKAVNTLDSMVGHRDERYLHFGWAAARLDDLANLIPARLTALLMVLVAPLLGLDAAGAWRCAWRDARAHASPNAGWPEAAAAGALGVRLGGLNYYGGDPYPSPYLGDPRRPLAPAHIRQAVALAWAVAVLAVLLGILALGALAPGGAAPVAAPAGG